MHIPPQETEELRLAAMKRYLEFSFERDRNLKDIVMLSSHILESPVSLITLIDEDVQWIISNHGIEIEKMPRETSFCTHAIMQNDIMVVNDALKDPRFVEAPLVKYNPHVRFYAGVPLKSNEGLNVGTLCVFDNQPKSPTDNQLSCLNALAGQVANIMALNMGMKLLKESSSRIESQYTTLRKIAYIQSHEVRAPLCNALAVMDMIKGDDYTTDKEHLMIMDNALRQLDKKIHSIVKTASLLN
jgi:GAF domain-containing protein